ncbi:hypothetical protein PTNB29_08043 [Pyrenophora teres f. teres]|nr:hypothetical protein PTNB29_08043 [Pyrenophora teres f. teres]
MAEDSFTGDWAPETDGIIFNPNDRDAANDCSNGLCGPNLSLNKFFNDTDYPQEYLNQRDAWLQEFKDIGPKPLPTSISAKPLQDPSLKCNFDPIFVGAGDPVQTTFAKTKVEEVCNLFDEITLNDSSQKEVIMTYAQINIEIHIWAAWNSGDPNCIKRGSNAMAKDHCVKMYN